MRITRVAMSPPKLGGDALAKRGRGGLSNPPRPYPLRAAFEQTPPDSGGDWSTATKTRATRIPYFQTFTTRYFAAPRLLCPGHV